MSRFKDLTGQKFGRLTALYKLHNYHNYNDSNKKYRTYWLCICDCGNLVEMRYDCLTTGNTRSCGCSNYDNLIKHGQYGTTLYRRWNMMLQRCCNKKHKEYHNYGGRGIAVCDEWQADFTNFYDWAINNDYQPNLTIDRIDVNGNYEPSNCRWITNKEQQNNRRDNVNITFNNITKTIAEWSEILNIKYGTLYNRYNNDYNITEMLTKRTDGKHLYPHQVDVLGKLYHNTRSAMFLEMGTGKTITGAIKATSYHKPVLIVCPKSVIPQWLECFDEWCKDYCTYNLTKKKQLEQFIDSDNYLRMGVINYESCWRRSELLKLKGFTLILDESQAISNSTSKQSKGICKLSFDNIVLLSGTPCANARYDKLYTQLKLLGLQMNKRSYEDRYCNFFEMEQAGVKFRVLSKKNPYKNVDELKQVMHDLGAVFMKTDEVIDLPEQRFINVWVNKSKYYKTFEKDGYVDCGEVEYISNGPAQDMLYLRQLCNSSEKLDMLRTLIEGTNDRVVVFYNFDIELKVLQQLCKKLKRPISYINGHEKNLNCYNNNEDSITLVQYQSGSAGVNLQKANKIIYYSPPVKSDFYEQSKKRIHRIGQNNKCTYWKLITHDSIEFRIYQTLKLKQDYTEALFEHDKN